jgi:hypothetical protein
MGCLFTVRPEAKNSCWASNFSWTRLGTFLRYRPTKFLDSHHLERALGDAVAGKERVLVLEDVDQMVKVMEPHVFFKLMDLAMERSDGFFWIANSRHPEEAPKTQLLRPGRFDEAVRLEFRMRNFERS